MHFGWLLTKIQTGNNGIIRGGVQPGQTRKQAVMMTGGDDVL
jgi:hypothetical protein